MGSKSYTTSSPTLTQEQKDQIAAQTGFFTGTIAPTYKSAVEGATNLYNTTAPGALNAAQNLAGTADQAQQALGGTGESALRTGISGLENLFSKDYESNQIAAAMGPAQAQYLQNLEMQQRQFGGAGMLGSSREALADRQLAGSNQMNQAMLAAQIQKDIQAALDKAKADAANTNINKFLNNLESRIYAQISQNLATAMFANGGSNSGTLNFEGNTIFWTKDGTNVTMQVTDVTGNQTTVVIPLSQFQFQ
jgi:membrane-bound inhibitor of C-type lysozyme